MRDKSQRTIEIACKKIAQTDRSYLLHDGTKQAWVPKQYVIENDDGTFTMSEWLAKDKEFI